MRLNEDRDFAIDIFCAYFYAIIVKIEAANFTGVPAIQIIRRPARMHRLIIENTAVNYNPFDCPYSPGLQRVCDVFEYPARLPAVPGIGFLIAQQRIAASNDDK